MTPHPPLGDAARAALSRIPFGPSVHLSVVSVVCNGLHRHTGPARALDCAACRFRHECRAEVDAAIIYVSELTPP